MKIVCSLSLFLLIVVVLPSRAQQVAMVEAPAPAMHAAANSAEPVSALPGAVMPVPSRTALPERQSFAVEDWGLLGGAAVLRFLDYKSTVKCMSDPANFHEVELPNALVHNDPAFGAFEAGMVGVNYYAYRLFVRHHHRTMARLGQEINLAAMGWTVGRNYYEINEFWPRASGPLVRH